MAGRALAQPLYDRTFTVPSSRDLPGICWRFAINLAPLNGRKNQVVVPSEGHSTDGSKMPAVRHRARFALFDSSSAKGAICVVGDVACRTRSNPHAFGVHGHFAAGAGCVYSALHGVVVARDKHDAAGTAIESSDDGRVGCRTAGSICNGILGQTRTRVLIQSQFPAGQRAWKRAPAPRFFGLFRRPTQGSTNTYAEPIPCGVGAPTSAVFFESDIESPKRLAL